MTTHHNNGNYASTMVKSRKSGFAVGEATAAIDDKVVNSIVHHVMSELQGTAASAPRARPSAKGSSAPVPSLVDFAHELDAIVASNQELRDHLREVVARSVGQALADDGLDVPSADDFAEIFEGFSLKAKGGTVARAFWWGFHVQISREDLRSFLDGAGSVNAIVAAFGGSIPSPAQPFITLAAVFVSGALGLLESLDRGSGVYISMTWFAPGIFVPTSV